ncbi:antiterminator Q family protein [Rodentibacter caecimuris]|uniref:antiterminator Q family protein n=1 Tax=Rodentibacter caecimuris TaxID=1796644 RepID=UPI0022495668|nr:antiterminator Q family protein [Rodentibacter heylii]MCX2960318.1 antiterminator Q family protein [Rodentibacter heylii]
MSSINIDRVAVQWGYWATPRYGTEFPRVSAGFAQVKPNAEYAYKPHLDPISDDLGMQINECMLIMHKVNPELYDVFMLTYVDRWNWKDIKNYLNISKHTYFERLATAKTSLKLMLHTGQVIFVA